MKLQYTAEEMEEYSYPGEPDELYKPLSEIEQDAKNERARLRAALGASSSIAAFERLQWMNTVGV